MEGKEKEKNEVWGRRGKGGELDGRENGGGLREEGQGMEEWEVGLLRRGEL